MFPAVARTSFLLLLFLLFPSAVFCSSDASSRHLLYVVASSSTLQATNNSILQIKTLITNGGSTASVQNSCYSILSDPTIHDQWTYLYGQTTCSVTQQSSINSASIVCSPAQIVPCTTAKQNLLHSQLNLILNGEKTFVTIRAPNDTVITTHGRRLLASTDNPAINNTDAAQLYLSLYNANNIFDTLAKTFYATGQTAKNNNKCQMSYIVRRDTLGTAVQYTFSDNTTVSYASDFLTGINYADTKNAIDTRILVINTNVFTWTTSPGTLVSNIIMTNRTNTTADVVLNTASTKLLCKCSLYATDAPVY